MQHNKAISWSLFLFIFAAEFSVGFYLSYILKATHFDALSRVANAFYVLYSRDPHLSAIGFIWNPLPSLMNLILLVFYPIFPSLASYGLSAVIVSSVFAGLIAVLLFQACRFFKLSTWLSLTIVFLFSFNPFMFLYGANGLSDAPYIYFLMYTLFHFVVWFDQRTSGSLVRAGIGLSLAFWCRYEAVPVGVALALGIVIVILTARTSITDSRNRILERYYQIEATWMILLIPAICSGLLWIFLNYTIMGNPFYFLNSEYSNIAQSDTLNSREFFQQVFGNAWLSFLLCLKLTAWFSAPLIGILLIRLFNKRLLKWDVWTLLIVVLSIPALQFLLIYKGSSFAWFRYFMYVFPITMAWLPYELSKVKKTFGNVTIVLTSLILSMGLLTYALSNPSIAPDENEFLNLKDGRYLVGAQLDRSVSNWINENLGEDVAILTDSASAYLIVLNSEDPRKFIITSDTDFGDALIDPIGAGVDFILLPKPPNYSTINAKYPKLYNNGEDWATLFKVFTDEKYNTEWRLYKIVDPAAATSP